jgi:hypothetical protein
MENLKIRELMAAVEVAEKENEAKKISEVKDYANCLFNDNGNDRSGFEWLEGEKVCRKKFLDFHSNNLNFTENMFCSWLELGSEETVKEVNFLARLSAKNADECFDNFMEFYEVAENNSAKTTVREYRNKLLSEGIGQDITLEKLMKALNENEYLMLLNDLSKLYMQNLYLKDIVPIVEGGREALTAIYKAHKENIYIDFSTCKELKEEKPFEIFHGHRITLKSFEDILSNLEGQPVSIELFMNDNSKKQLITAVHLNELQLDIGSTISFNELDMSQIGIDLPVDSIDEILVGDGFIYLDHWLVHLSNGLEYYIYVGM